LGGGKTKIDGSKRGVNKKKKLKNRKTRDTFLVRIRIVSIQPGQKRPRSLGGGGGGKTVYSLLWCFAGGFPGKGSLPAARGLVGAAHGKKFFVGCWGVWVWSNKKNATEKKKLRARARWDDLSVKRRKQDGRRCFGVGAGNHIRTWGST